MKSKKVLSSIIATIIMLTSIVGFSISANAEDNPYNYSGEPTRAIYYVTPTMKGNDVKWVQCALNLYGNYGLAIDGSFGPACREATKKFQASIGLEQDGSFGPATRAKMVEWLNSRNSSTPPQAQPEPQQPQQTASISDNPYNYSSVPSRAIYYVLPTMKGNDVKWVQSALNAYGNYGLSIDGSFGPACRNATKQFQASMGMTQDGSFGPATRAKMVEWLNGKVNSNNSSNNNTNSGIEKAIFPMDYLNISQGINENYSHQNRLALDLIGSGNGNDSFRAPFTGVIKKIYGKDNVVWFESINDVQFADGTISKMTIMCMHDNDISDIYVGKTIHQNESFLTVGTAGNATGPHIHLECGNGSFSGTGWYKNSSGKWCINNGINPWDALYIKSSTNVINSHNYNWRIIN